MPYQHYLDRTGKYGFGGRHRHYTKLSEISRGKFWPIFEQPLHHYAGRRGVAAPFTARVVEMKRPEGANNDHVGHGTLTHWRPPYRPAQARTSPGTPAGLAARTTADGILLTWVRSVEPVSYSDAKSYIITRTDDATGEFKEISSGAEPSYLDETVERGKIYRYQVRSVNDWGLSETSAELTASFGLPKTWSSRDIGAVQVAGHAAFDGSVFTIVAEGKRIGGSKDQCHFAFAPMKGDGTITARITFPLSSQWSQLGVMMRDSLEPESAHASVMLLPTDWRAALVSRKEMAGETSESGRTQLGEPFIEKGDRLMKPYWLRLSRAGDTFTGSISADGKNWEKIAATEIGMGQNIQVGLAACSQLKQVTTTVSFDHVEIAAP